MGSLVKKNNLFSLEAGRFMCSSMGDVYGMSKIGTGVLYGTNLSRLQPYTIMSSPVGGGGCY